jgi:hypothetical protein
VSVMGTRIGRRISTGRRWLAVLAATQVVLVPTRAIPARGAQAEGRPRNAQRAVVRRGRGRYARGGSVRRIGHATELCLRVRTLEGSRGSRAICYWVEELVDGGALVVLLMQAVHPVKRLWTAGKQAERTMGALEREERGVATDEEGEEGEACTARAPASVCLSFF